MESLQNWPDLRSLISKFQNIRIVWTEVLTCSFQSIKSIPKTVFMAQLRSYGTVILRPNTLTLLGDLTWPDPKLKLAHKICNSRLFMEISGHGIPAVLHLSSKIGWEGRFLPSPLPGRVLTLAGTGHFAILDGTRWIGDGEWGWLRLRPLLHLAPNQDKTSRQKTSVLAVMGGSRWYPILSFSVI